MDYRYHLLHRGAMAHYSSMLASLMLIAGCTSGDLTENSELSDASLAEAFSTADARGGRGPRNRSQLTDLTISPGSVSLLSGTTQRFVATGKLKDGSTTSTRVNWTATGGRIDDNGLYTSGTAGVHRVIATAVYSSLVDTAVVTVSEKSEATLVSVTVSPGSTTVAAGGTQRFAVSGKLSDGASVTPTVTWAVTGGTITSDGLYTAGSQAGTYRAIARHQSNLADTATVTIPAPSTSPPPPSDGSLPFAPDAPAAVRTINVDTQSELLAAVNNAQPGDHIVLAAGTYVGGVQMACGKGGTAQRPIVIRGSATIDANGMGYGFRVRGPNVQIRGLTIRDAQFGVSVERCDGYAEPTDVVLDQLDIGSVRQNGVVLWNAHRAYVQRGRIHDVSGATWTEGIYVGHSREASKMSHDVRVLGMRMGPNIRQEHIDVKGLSGGRSSRCLIQGNTFDAAGSQFVEVPASNGIISDQGASDCRYEDNTIVNISSTGLNGFFFYTSVRPTVRNNEVAPDRNRISGAYGYRVASPVTDPKIYCDNTGTRNTSCVP